MAILRRNCPHCPTENVGFDVRWAERIGDKHHIWNCAAICGACRKPVAFVASAQNANIHANPSQHNGEIEPTWIVPVIWPIVTPTSAPPHTPPLVRKRFLEGEDSFKRRNWNAAVAMYRSALDIATKGMDGVPQGKSFFERLIWLHDQHRITPDIKAWADHVRVDGNAALHDPEEFTGDDAKALRFFTEMFLRYVFELPGEVAEFRAKAEGAK